MSTAIGIGYSAHDHADLFDELKLLANKYGYGLLNGLTYAESDMRAGVEIAQKHMGWHQVVFLQSPQDREVALAFGIEQEMTDFWAKGEPTRFFPFLKELIVGWSDKCQKLSLFFSGEWDAKDRVRYNSGTIDDLITLLSKPGSWGIVYLIPETGHFQVSDKIPLLFDVKLAGRKRCQELRAPHKSHGISVCRTHRCSFVAGGVALTGHGV